MAVIIELERTRCIVIVVCIAELTLSAHTQRVVGLRGGGGGVCTKGLHFSTFQLYGIGFKERQYSKTSLSGHSEKRTHSLQRTMWQSRIENPVYVIH